MTVSDGVSDNCVPRGISLRLNTTIILNYKQVILEVVHDNRVIVQTEYGVVVQNESGVMVQSEDRPVVQSETRAMV